MYVVTRDDLYLVPTAEVPVTNIHRDEIIEATDLPIRYVAYSPCFRREAGAAGKARGASCASTSSTRSRWSVREAGRLRRHARVADRARRGPPPAPRAGLPGPAHGTGDMGFVQAKKYDLEVWAPGVERWLEVSSCSNFRDYQARRMAIRCRPAAGRSRRSCTRSTARGWRWRGRGRAARGVPAGRRVRGRPGGHPGGDGHRQDRPAGLTRARNARVQVTGTDDHEAAVLVRIPFWGRFHGRKSSGSFPTGTSTSGLRESPQMLLWRGYQTSSMKTAVTVYELVNAGRPSREARHHPAVRPAPDHEADRPVRRPQRLRGHLDRGLDARVDGLPRTCHQPLGHPSAAHSTGPRCRRHARGPARASTRRHLLNRSFVNRPVQWRSCTRDPAPAARDDSDRSRWPWL